MRQANGRRRCSVTPSLTGWAHTQNEPCFHMNFNYPQTSNINRTWLGYKIVDHSDAFGAASVATVPTASSFSTSHLTMDCAKTTPRRKVEHVNLGIWWVFYYRFDGMWLSRLVFSTICFINPKRAAICHLWFCRYFQMHFFCKKYWSFFSIQILMAHADLVWVGYERTNVSEALMKDNLQSKVHLKIMMTSSNRNIFRVTGCAGNSPVSDDFPAQRPVTRSFYVFFDLRLNKRLSKQL